MINWIRRRIFLDSLEPKKGESGFPLKGGRREEEVELAGEERIERINGKLFWINQGEKKRYRIVVCGGKEEGRGGRERSRRVTRNVESPSYLSREWGKKGRVGVTQEERKDNSPLPLFFSCQ